MREHTLALAQAIGARLGSTRRRVALSQQALAHLAGVAPSYLCQVEGGRRGELSVAHLARVASVLGLSFDWLITGRGEPPSMRELCAAVARAEAAKGVPGSWWPRPVAPRPAARGRAPGRAATPRPRAVRTRRASARLREAS
jgi:transcriptional regulator with XRE-family HTH domain